MNYLDVFDSAKVWIKYVHFLNRKYYKNDFLEIGAGIGSFTDKYRRNIKNIFLTEIDKNNCVAIPAEKEARARKIIRKTDIRISSLLRKRSPKKSEQRPQFL